MIIDSHCHLDYQPLFNNLQNIIKRANNNGVKYFLTISTTDQSFKNILNILKKYNNIFGSYGIHPHEAKLHKYINKLDIIKKINLSKKIIGIGETGLDFYYNNSEKDKQIASFKEHIDASIKTNIPLIVHSRDAEEETFNILNEYKNENLKILMHCFTGSKEFSEN